MGASSSCCFSLAKAEESPSPRNDGVTKLQMVGVEGASTSGRTTEHMAKVKEESPSTVAVDAAVAESEAMTMVGAEGPSTSRRTEYYSARSEAMVRSRGQFSDDVALEIQFSESHRSEVSRLEVAPQSAEEEELNRVNREVVEEWEKDHRSLFRRHPYPFHLGRMIAEGGQAEIHEIVDQPGYLMKVFKRGTSLRDLRKSCPLPVLQRDVWQCIVSAGFLEDGRFAFQMHKYWGDLRKLIDQAMREKNMAGIQGPPFPYQWQKDGKSWAFFSWDLMTEIGKHMRDLHENGMTHRDLKASNILLGPYAMYSPHIMISSDIIVADFECSIGVLGTRYWRAPEVMLALLKRETLTNEQWEKADVYSYGMTCFEIVTGRIPFDGELGNTKVDRQLVIEGKRPQLPSDLDHKVKHLLTKCWEPNPSLRPTFHEIVDLILPVNYYVGHFIYRFSSTIHIHLLDF